MNRSAAPSSPEERNGLHAMDARGRGALGFHLLLIAVVLFLYGGAIRMYFLQDDFYQFTRARSLGELDWAEAFSLRTGYYRPLTQRVLASLQVWLFGYNPSAHHWLSLGVFALNGCLLFSLFRKITGRDGPAAVGVLFYVTRSAHFLTLYWLSAAAEAWMMLFFLLSIHLFLRAERAESGRRAALAAASAALYLLAILSKETVLLLPALLVVWAAAGVGETMATERPKAETAPRRFDWTRAIRLSGFHWTVLAVYLALRVGIGGLGGHGLYLLSKIDRAVLNAAAYVAMLLDVNRELLRQVALGEFPDRPLLLAFWGLAFLALWVAFPAWLLRRIRNGGANGAGGGENYAAFWRRRKPWLILATIWMCVGAAPLAAMTLNAYGYYMTPLLSGLALFVALHAEYAGDRLRAARGATAPRRAAIAFVVLMVLLPFFSIRIEESLPHGSFQRAEQVKRVLANLRTDTTPPPDHSVVLFTGLTRKEYWAFGWGYCLELIYGDRGYRYYSEFEESNTPSRIPVGRYTELRLAGDRFIATHREQTESRAGDASAAPPPGGAHNPHPKADP